MKNVWRMLALLALAGMTAGCGGDKEVEERGGNGMAVLEGSWEGAIEVPNQPLTIQVEFGKETSYFGIPSQGVNELQISRIEFIDPDISFDVEIQGQIISFDGKRKGEEITGTFTQTEQELPFKLKKGISEKPVNEENIVEADAAGGKMKAVLELPEGEGPFPAVVIIAGSGPTDHNGNSPAGGTNNSLKMLAEGLAAEGIASIRYDKRGIGMNTALGRNEADMRFGDFIADAAVWGEYLETDGRFAETAVIGHSEGALIGLVAAKKGGADRFISIAGAGRPIDEVLLEQLTPQLPADLLEESETVIAALKEGEEVKEVSPALQSIFRPSVQPYLASWMALDPQQEIRDLDVPALIVAGTHDIQVPVADAEALHAAKPEAELLIIDGMNHVLKPAPADVQGNMVVYSDPDLPLAEGLAKGIAQFIKAE